ncbi:uncharacterized protein L201_000217 [Kwoniella dendrophila CBS 6074]|uniref:Uncharacterized protein n=1 Tax=Kwoniella dendrophila CBS 6074 TaxID=1295534 RepID=A0AAX4JKE7_9TREE
MSAQNFIATQRDIACVRDTITGLQAFYRAVALHLNDLYQSQESTTIGQMRKIKRRSECNITKIRLHAIPVISNEGDTVEFGYSEWEQFQQRDLIPVKVQNGPFMVKLEVVYDEQYIGSLMKTFLFEENSETFLLTEIIDKVENFVLQHSTSGVDILSLDFDDVKQACHGLQYGGLSVEQVNISKFLAMTNMLKNYGAGKNYTDPSRKSLSTEDLRNWLSKHSRKYAFSKKDLSDRKAYYANYKVRTGTWEDEVDGEALRKARDVLAKVTSREVAILGRENYADIFPPTLQHPVRGTMKLYSNGEPKEMTLRALWYLYSKRSNPWTIINAKVADSFKKGYNMIASHIKNPTNHIEARRVRWAVQADLQKGIQILNNAANSPDEPFATLQIAQNDWKTWRTLLARSHREANATKVEMIAYIGNRIKEEFPGVVLSRETRNNLVYNLIDKLATEAARKAAGKTGLDYNYWSLQEQALVAVCLYVLGEAPVDPTQPLEVYPVGLANAIQLVLPTRTHSSISKALEEKSVGITRCYELLEQTIQEEGLQFLGSQLSAQTLRELEEYGYGRSNNN